MKNKQKILNKYKELFAGLMNSSEYHAACSSFMEYVMDLLFAEDAMKKEEERVNKSWEEVKDITNLKKEEFMKRNYRPNYKNL